MGSPSDNQTDDNNDTRANNSADQRGWRFWTILGSLCVATLAAAIESTGSFSQ